MRFQCNDCHSFCSVILVCFRVIFNEIVFKRMIGTRVALQPNTLPFVSNLFRVSSFDYGLSHFYWSLSFVFTFIFSCYLILRSQPSLFLFSLLKIVAVYNLHFSLLVFIALVHCLNRSIVPNIVLI